MADEQERSIREAGVASEVLHATHVAIIAVDPDLRCVWANDPAAELSGRSVTELKARSITEFLPAITPALHERMRSARETRAPLREEVYVASENRWLEYTLISSNDGALIIAADVSSDSQASGRTSVLNALGELIRRTEEPTELLFRVASLVGEFLEVRRCLFNEIVLERDAEIVHRDYCRGVASVAGEHRVSDYSPVTSAAMREGKTIVNFDASTDPRTAELYEAVYAKNGERAYVAVPLLRDGRWVASLWVSDDRPRRWTPHEVSLLETVAERSWLAVEKLRVDAALRDSEERLRLAIDAAGMFSWASDPRTMTITWSPNAARIIGCSPDELPTRMHDALFFVAAHDRERLDAELAKLVAEREETFTFEFAGNEASAPRAWRAEGRIVFDSSGAVQRVVGVTQDVTARRRAEEERERLLASEQSLRLRAEESSRLKDEFLAMVSHELRTPMTATLGWASLLKTTRLDETTLRSAYEAIENSVRAQTRIVDDLLDVSRIIAGKLRIEPRVINVIGPIQEAITTIEPAASARYINVDLRYGATPALVAADAARLQQVFWNLLSNAVRFTPPGGRIVIDVGRDEKHVTVSVTDSGEGIDPDFLPRLFERFTQHDVSTTRKHGGLGLGLSIVRYIVELHGGAITARSEGRGHGATFTVTLPHVDSGTAMSVETRASAPILDGRTVLVVDDDIEQTRFLDAALRAFGAAVVTANSAPVAIAAARRQRPDLVLTDIAMPEEDGYALAAALLKIDPSIRLVAITAYGRGEERERARAAGFREVITKPADAVEIAKTLAAVLAGA